MSIMMIVKDRVVMTMTDMTTIIMTTTDMTMMMAMDGLMMTTIIIITTMIEMIMTTIMITIGIRALA
jgi:hypothetical protein